MQKQTPTRRSSSSSSSNNSFNNKNKKQENVKLPPIHKTSSSTSATAAAGGSAGVIINKTKTLMTNTNNNNNSNNKTTLSWTAPAAASNGGGGGGGDRRQILTLLLDTEENSVFSSLAQYLFNNNQPGYGTESRWINSRVRINPANVAADNRTPCCIQLSGINFYLGTKLVTERLVQECHIICTRAKRNHGQLHVCKHMKKKDEIPDSEYTSYPNRIVVSFVPGTKMITLKANMAKSLCDVYTAAVAFSQITPESYVLVPRRESANGGLADQRTQWLRSINKSSSSSGEGAGGGGSNKIWIAKQSHGAKGRGIRLVVPSNNNNSASSTTTRKKRELGEPKKLSADVYEFLDDLDRQFDSNPWVVQQYIHKPMLMNGYKFDLRAWVLLTPRLEVFLYREGVCRMCSEKYDDGGDYSDVYAHISNHCIHADRRTTSSSSYQQQQQQQQQQRQQELEISWDEMQKQLWSKIKCKNGQMLSFEKHIRPQMARIIGQTLSCVKPSVLEIYNHGAIDTWQYFGFDFVLESAEVAPAGEVPRLWLLEVNGAPGVRSSLQQFTVEDLAERVVYDMLPSSRPTNNSSDRKTKRPNFFDKIFSKEEW